MPHLILHCRLPPAERIRRDLPLERMGAKRAKHDGQTAERCPNRNKPSAREISIVIAVCHILCLLGRRAVCNRRIVVAYATRERMPDFGRAAQKRTCR